ncbi:hypothetical protein [Magnetospirillum molischianum]|uniref:Phage-related protein n=1 Tax=Magnetospirillum molischianum DSM 120 TaxID=1150626 RepID=H8FY59_MAGML|nr:hypothetical protein [Magnetospirillum molischianum]CCG43297.1 hypothetical protein PHAMO_80088 [Magnetospirillum molischianum DSM 120]
MTVRSFPAISGRDQKYYNEKLDNPAAGSKSEGGYEFTRPKFTRRPRRTFADGYTAISQAEKTSLEQFWNDVRGSSDIFLWTSPITGESVQVRFVLGKTLDFKYSHFQKTLDDEPDHRWDVSFEVREA